MSDDLLPGYEWYGEPDTNIILEFLRGFKPKDLEFFSVQRKLTAKEEAEGRSALAALLRGHFKLDPDTRARRQALFEEVCDRLGEIIAGKTRRQIAFKNRKGRLPQYDKDNEIIFEVRKLVRERVSVETAVAKVARKFRLSESRVLKIWSRRRKAPDAKELTDLWNSEYHKRVRKVINAPDGELDKLKNRVAKTVQSLK